MYEARDLDRSNKGERCRDHSHLFIPLLCFQNTLHFFQDRCQFRELLKDRFKTFFACSRKYSKSHLKNTCKGLSSTEFDRNMNAFLSISSTFVQLLVLITSLFLGHLSVLLPFINN